mgnify:FL=1
MLHLGMYLMCILQRGIEQNTGCPDKLSLRNEAVTGPF